MRILLHEIDFMLKNCKRLTCVVLVKTNHMNRIQMCKFESSRSEEIRASGVPSPKFW